MGDSRGRVFSWTVSDTQGIYAYITVLQYTFVFIPLGTLLICLCGIASFHYTSTVHSLTICLCMHVCVHIQYNIVLVIMYVCMVVYYK